MRLRARARCKLFSCDSTFRITDGRPNNAHQHNTFSEPHITTNFLVGRWCATAIVSIYKVRQSASNPSLRWGRRRRDDFHEITWWVSDVEGQTKPLIDYFSSFFGMMANITQWARSLVSCIAIQVLLSTQRLKIGKRPVKVYVQVRFQMTLRRL